MNATRLRAATAAAMGLSWIALACITPAAEPAASGRENSELRILYTSQANNQDNMYVLGLDGKPPVQLTHERAKDSHGIVSPDGKRIVFNSERVGWWKIWTMDVDGSNVQQFTFPKSGADYHPNWSADSSKIIYAAGAVGNGDIMIAAADGSGTTNLTNHPAADNFPAWSPDGSKVAFASDRDEGWGIYVVDPTGKHLHRVPVDGQAIEPAWFPGSERLVFQSNASGSMDLYAVDVSQDFKFSKPQQLTRHEGDEKRPAVSPDGRFIAFESNRDGRSDIYVMDASGESNEPARRLTSKRYNFSPSWFPLSK